MSASDREAIRGGEEVDCLFVAELKALSRSPMDICTDVVKLFGKIGKWEEAQVKKRVGRHEPTTFEKDENARTHSLA